MSHLKLFAMLILLTSASTAFPQDRDVKGTYGSAKKQADVADRRPGPLKDLNGYFPFTPPTSREAWDKRAEQLRRQVLVATGLWPMPERTPPNAIIHGRVDRDDYTVEKVILESWPGHYVTGNLYRPKGTTGKIPAVLCPHGHWANGRFYDAGESQLKKQVENGGEKYDPSGRYPLQARCVQLARMGCLVFHYDMLGYADSVQIPHEVAHGFRERRPQMERDDGWGFFSPQAELHLQNVMGLQTYNSIRALDWVSELPEVDSQRIGVTGASGGGTQTFILAAIDPRVTVAFPAVMVSTAMQGGCTCENCTYLRVGTGNIELAALIAPRPLGMTAADDWTKEIETKGLPELKQLYKLIGAPDNVMAKAFLQYDHNYNYPSRAVMYEWMNKHLGLGKPEPIVEESFTPLARHELTVWNDSHPKPKAHQVGESNERKLLRQMTEESNRQVSRLAPHDEATLHEFRRVIGGGFAAMIGRSVPAAGDVTVVEKGRTERDSFTEISLLAKLPAHGEERPLVVLKPKQWNGQVILWLDEKGKSAIMEPSGAPHPAARNAVDKGAAVVGIDLISQPTGPASEAGRNRKVSGDRNFAGFTYGYNHPLIAQRVHDVLTALVALRQHLGEDARLNLYGAGPAAVWAAAARSQAGNLVSRMALDTQGFRLGEIRDLYDAHFWPGAAKYGDLPSLIAHSAPQATRIAGESQEALKIITAAYESAGAKSAFSTARQADAQSAIDWLLE